MKPLIKRILREQTDPTFSDKVWAAVKGVGKFALKNNSLSWLIKTLVGATPTKARLIFPKEGWETAAVEILEQIGIVTGTYESMHEANKFFRDLKKNGIVLEELLIGSHGSPGNLLATQKGGRKIYKQYWVDSDELFKSSGGKDGQKGYWVTTSEVLYESGMRYAFKTYFLKHIKPVVNSKTKVYFTACHGAEKLTMLKEAADYLGCEYSGQRSSKEKVVVHGDEKLHGYKSAQAYTDKVNDFYVENGVCQEQPNIPFNWITLFG